MTGHIFQRDFPVKYRSWNSIEPVKLFDVDTIKVASNPKQKLKEFLQGLCKGADAIVLWLDNDKEGENICFEILDCVASSMSKQNFM